MSDVPLTIEAGVRYLTSDGPVTVIELTSMQAKVQPENGDEPRWILRAHLQAMPPPSEEDAEPTVEELLTAAASLIEQARAKMLQDKR